LYEASLAKYFYGENYSQMEEPGERIKSGRNKNKSSKQKVSDKNCLVRCKRVATIVFLIPTSFDFFIASAVERLT